MIDIYKIKKIMQNNKIDFGLLKSKIEKILTESYSNNQFKFEMKVFKTLVLENKNISKLFYLYDELNSNKGISESIVNDYINECITIYENTINKLSPKDFNQLKLWTSDVKTENKYEKIDDLFRSDVLTIENKISSRKLIAESLKKPQNKSKDIIELPISSIVNLANKTINQYIENLNESDKQELLKILSVDEKDMENSYQQIKENVIEKLNNLTVDSDLETKQKIEESINKIKSEKFDKLNFYRLKSLNENI
jgi:hypothetical protein